MTSINAIKFDDYSGVCVCDEARCWNEEDLKIYAAEKIKPCIPDAVALRYGTVAAYGNTGSSTIGDEIKWSIQKRIREELDQRTEKAGKPPESFMTMEEISAVVFDVITRLKHTHINDQLKGRYNFDTSDFIRGYYKKGDEKIEIKDKDLIKTVEKFITWKDNFSEVNAVFVNAGLLAGYEESEGFRLFHYSMIESFCEPVQAAFIVDGSGRDATGISLADYMDRKTIPERGKIDRVEGVIAILEAVNLASRFNLGVEGYYNIILMDGREKDYSKRLVEINDHRSKLASEIVLAMTNRLISGDSAYKLIEELFFKGKTFTETAEMFVKSTESPKKLRRLLRGYKLESGL